MPMLSRLSEYVFSLSIRIADANHPNGRPIAKTRRRHAGGLVGARREIRRPQYSDAGPVSVEVCRGVGVPRLLYRQCWRSDYCDVPETRRKSGAPWGEGVDSPLPRAPPRRVRRQGVLDWPRPCVLGLRAAFRRLVLNRWDSRPPSFGLWPTRPRVNVGVVRVRSPAPVKRRRCPGRPRGV